MELPCLFYEVLMHLDVRPGIKVLQICKILYDLYL